MGREKNLVEEKKKTGQHNTHGAQFIKCNVQLVCLVQRTQNAVQMSACVFVSLCD